MVPGSGPIHVDEERLLLGIHAADCSRFSSRRLGGHSAPRQRGLTHEATLVNDAMHGLNRLHAARMGSDEDHICRQEFSVCTMLEVTRQFARRVAHTWLLGKMLFSFRGSAP